MFSRQLLLKIAKFSNISTPRSTIFRNFSVLPAISQQNPQPSAVEILHKSIEILRDKGRTVFLDDVENFAQKSVVPILLRHNFGRDEILDLLTFWSDENLNGDFWFHVDAREVNALFEVFSINGVDGKHVATLLMKEKKVLELDPDQLQMKILNLRHIFAPKIDESPRNKQIFGKFLVENSQILFKNEEENYRLSKSELRNFFSSEQVNKMLSRNPEILLQKNFQDLELLYEYFYFVMAVDGKLLTKIRWFDKDFKFVRLRHEFALKTGAFIRYNEKKPALSAKSIRLEKIIESTDSNFAQCCKSSLEEYEFFRKIYGPKFEDLDDFKAQIAKNCRHKSAIREKYGRKFEDRDDEMAKNSGENFEEDQDFEQEEEQTLKIPGFNNDRPVKINAQWSERWRK